MFKKIRSKGLAALLLSLCAPVAALGQDMRVGELLKDIRKSAPTDMGVLLEFEDQLVEYLPFEVKARASYFVALDGKRVTYRICSDLSNPDHWYGGIVDTDRHIGFVKAGASRVTVGERGAITRSLGLDSLCSLDLAVGINSSERFSQGDFAFNPGVVRQLLTDKSTQALQLEKVGDDTLRGAVQSDANRVTLTIVRDTTSGAISQLEYRVVGADGTAKWLVTKSVSFSGKQVRVPTSIQFEEHVDGALARRLTRKYTNVQVGSIPDSIFSKEFLLEGYKGSIEEVIPFTDDEIVKMLEEGQLPKRTQKRLDDQLLPKPRLRNYTLIFLLVASVLVYFLVTRRRGK